MLPFRDENPTRHSPWVTIALILINVAVYFVIQPQASTTPTGVDESIEFSYQYAAVPCELVNNRPLSSGEIGSALAGDDDGCAGNNPPECPVSINTSVCVEEAFPDKSVPMSVLNSMFLHGSLMHLGGNMLFLWVFGNNIEDHLGPIKFVLFYLAAGAIATAAHVLVQLDSVIPVIGASGAVAGVMGAYLVWFPRARIQTLVFIMLTWVPAFIVLSFWFISQFFIGPDDGVAWMAHVGGFVFGILVGLLVRMFPGLRRKTWHRDYADTAGRSDEPIWDDRHGGLIQPDRYGDRDPSPWGHIK